MSDDARTDAVEYVRDEMRKGFSVGTNATRQVLAEVDRLRAELDRHRVAGDAMADELDQSTGISDPDVQRLTHAWRSVRGDAPEGRGDTE